MANSRTNQQIKLKDGRMLGHAEYGDPDGKPVLYFHGFPGSRLDWQPFDDGSASDMKARIVAVDRPGYGLSDFKRGRKILDWPDDVIELADALRLDRFAVMGASGGGPYVAACAFKIPKRLTAAAMVCGMGPSEAPGIKDGIAWKSGPGKSRLMRRLTYMLLSMALRKQPSKVVSNMKKSVVGPDKVFLLEKPECAEKLIDAWREGLRSGSSGVSHEAVLFARPWEFRLQDIATEVHLWHGEQDGNVPVSAARYVAGAIPNCHARFPEDEGHLSLIYNYHREFLNVLAA